MLAALLKGKGVAQAGAAGASAVCTRLYAAAADKKISLEVRRFAGPSAEPDRRDRSR